MYIVEVLHVATSQVQDAGACGGGPRGRSSPHVRGKRSGRTTVCVRASAYGAGSADTAGADVKAQQLHVGQQLQAGQELTFGRG